MDLYWKIIQGLPTTFALTVIAFAIGAVAAIPLMLARRSSRIWLWLPARAITDLSRAVPPIVWLFLIFFGLPQVGLSLQPFTAAAVGLGLISSAYLAEIYRGGLIAIDRGQWEAGSALGLHGYAIYRYVVGPQAFRVALPTLATYAIGLLKDTALAYTIGVHEVLFRANSEAVSGHGSPLAILAFAGALYVALSLATSYVARRLEGAGNVRGVR